MESPPRFLGPLLSHTSLPSLTHCLPPTPTHLISPFCPTCVCVCVRAWRLFHSSQPPHVFPSLLGIPFVQVSMWQTPAYCSIELFITCSMKLVSILSCKIVDTAPVLAKAAPASLCFSSRCSATCCLSTCQRSSDLERPLIDLELPTQAVLQKPGVSDIFINYG